MWKSESANIQIKSVNLKIKYIILFVSPTWCGNSVLSDMRHFAIRSLFNNNMIAAWNGQINGGERRSNVEWHPVVLGDDRNLIGANLVGRITVGGDLLR